MTSTNQPSTETGERGKRVYRILMVAPTSFFADYGCHVRILEEARVLQGLGHRVTIVAYRNGNDVPDLDIERTLPIPWRRHYEVGSSRHKIVFDALLGLKTLQLLMRNRYDVIHAHLHEGALIGLVLGRLFGVPVVFDFQGSLTAEMIDHQFLTSGGRAHRWLSRLERWIDGKPSAIFTSSLNAERLLVEQFGCLPERIHPLPDCVDTTVFRPRAAFDPERVAAMRRRLALPDDARVIVYLGLLAEYQGTSLLLEAMQLLQERFDDVYLLLMGYPGEDTYQQKAFELGVAERVRFTGRIPYPQAPLHLALGNVAVAPKMSLSEGSGKLLNYMAAALPTVAFDTPVAREYLGLHANLARLGDVESLADTLAHVLQNLASAAAAGQQLRVRARQHFEWRAAGRDIVNVYAGLFGNGQSDDRSIPRLDLSRQE